MDITPNKRKSILCETLCAKCFGRNALATTVIIYGEICVDIYNEQYQKPLGSDHHHNFTTISDCHSHRRCRLRYRHRRAATNTTECMSVCVCSVLPRFCERAVFRVDIYLIYPKWISMERNRQPNEHPKFV